MTPDQSAADTARARHADPAGRGFIHQMEPWFDEREANAVRDYLLSGGWVTEFTKTREFERAIADYTGAAYCSVVTNGTISLTLALLACGVGPGDEVIVPDFTMAASPNAVQPTGATVRFVDIDRTTLCLDFERMCAAVGPSTRAVMLVTINGRSPANIDEYVRFCRDRNIWLVEDAAQSLGSKSGGRHLGTFGDIGSFSFSAPKVVTTGQGGALVTDNERLIEAVRRMRDFGRPRGGADEYLSMGWNFKFTDLQAVVGLVQMEKLAWRVERKKAIYALYREWLGDVPQLALIPTNLEDTSPWFIDVLVEDGSRAALMAALKAAGIGSREFYPALHSQPVYALPEHHPVAEAVAAKGLWLPSSSKLTDDQVRDVCGEIRRFYRL